VATILVCYFITSQNGHLPMGVTTPPISFLGAQEPEHTVYQIGFSLTGLLLAFSVCIWHREVEPLLMDADFVRAAAIAAMGGWFACLGAAGQGLVTLETDILAVVSTPDSTMSRQSVLHQVLAAFFFLGAAVHCYSMSWVLSWADPSNAGLQRLFSPSSRRFKTACCLGTVVASPLAQALHPAARAYTARKVLEWATRLVGWSEVLAVGEPVRRAAKGWIAGLKPGSGSHGDGAAALQFSIAGVVQYVTVVLYIIYFGSYSWDLYYYHRGDRRGVCAEKNKKA